MEAKESTEFHCVVYYGPPNSGKTSSYNHHLLDSHLRISPSGLLKQNPELNLRLLINKHVIQPLLKGQKVCIDDCNASKAKRNSYISLINKKVEGCEICCVVVTPAHGVQQQYWAAQCVAAEQMLIGLDPVTDTDHLIDKWQQQCEEPTEAEGFIKVLHVTSNLQVTTVFKFEVPCLLVQWEAVWKQGQENGISLQQGVTPAFKTWYKSNPCGRIIIVHDGTLRPGESKEDVENNIEYILQEITDEVSCCPVYLFHTDRSLGHSPPHPSIIAFLQRLHHLNIHTKDSLYLYHTSSHMKMAEQAGMQHIKASRVFQKPHLVCGSGDMRRPVVPTMLAEITLVPVPAEYQLPTEPTVPLYKSATGAGGRMYHCSARGRTLYLASTNMQALTSYQELYARHASKLSSSKEGIAELCREAKLSVQRPPAPSRQHSTQDYTHRPLPKWMTSRKSSKTDNTPDPTPKDDSTPNSVVEGSRVHSTVYVMTVAEAREAAQYILTQAGMPIPQQRQEYDPEADNKPQEQLSDQARTPRKKPRSRGRQKREESTEVDPSTATKFTSSFHVPDTSSSDKRSSTKSVSVGSVPDSFVQNTSTEKSNASNISVGSDIVGDSFVSNTSSNKSKSPKLQSDRSHISDSLVQNTSSSAREKSSSSNSKRSVGSFAIPDSIVPNTSSEKSSSKESKQSGSFLIPDSFVARTSTDKSRSSSSGPGRRSCSSSSSAVESKRSRQSSGVVVPDSFVPETITTIPETVNSLSRSNSTSGASENLSDIVKRAGSSVRRKVYGNVVNKSKSTTSSDEDGDKLVGKDKKKEDKTVRRKRKEVDVSFLDDIFKL